MKTIHVEQAVVTHSHAWNKWPDTDDADYTPVLAMRREEHYAVPSEGTQYVVTTRFIPAYLGHIFAGRRELPPDVPFPHINNMFPPHHDVLLAQAGILRTASEQGCSVLAWDHAHQCFPWVASQLKSWFDLAYLIHADDCPGSSEVKTFPVARYFDALFYQMHVFDGRDGRLTAPEYHARGLADCRWKASNESTGLSAWISDTGFSFDAKISKIIRRELGVDMVFVGCAGRRANPRDDLLREMNTSVGVIPSDWNVRLHGKTGFRSGPLLPMEPPGGPGYTVAPLYADALFGINAPISSVFNCRLMDLWIMGCVQVVLDPLNELPAHGFVPWEHYLPCPRDLTNLIAMLNDWRARPADCARVATGGRMKAMEFLRNRSTTMVIGEILYDYLDGPRKRTRA